ncbi:RNA polymerase sigma factor [Alkalicoccobacillus plakortidis]|uniref:Sigma-70 family RNA polymerase sigma factor n=1 Tax=Alkalicoccobacillus plakortidis TaxID=444060 RepID=A0ABT0XK39_9BACI|nr:sigma-70 family RNA polymerase sigma factor [Alkalicoccobacillus plakortidis]MCM2676266.1 sigma-70 family RNA polymerase sigma factor [Alkalicoccobacillus plakortidis]
MERLVKKAKKGDGDAFVQLIQQYEEVLYRTAIRFVKDEQDTADLLQDTILTAFERLHTLKKNEYFHTWLCKILLNKCTSLVKKKQKTQVLDLPNQLLEAADSFKDIELADALNSLSDQYRLVFTLYYVVGYTTKEISTMINEPEGTIKSRLSRGKAILRDTYYTFEGVKTIG